MDKEEVHGHGEGGHEGAGVTEEDAKDSVRWRWVIHCKREQPKYDYYGKVEFLFVYIFSPSYLDATTPLPFTKNVPHI